MALELPTAMFTPVSVMGWPPTMREMGSSSTGAAL